MPSQRWRRHNTHNDQLSSSVRLPEAAVTSAVAPPEFNVKSRICLDQSEFDSDALVPNVEHISRRWARKACEGDVGYPDAVELRFGQRKASQQQSLTLRAAHDARKSAELAGMTATVESAGDSNIQTTVLGGEAFYLPEWFCRDRDRTLYEGLLRELHSYIKPFRGKSLGLSGTQDILDACPIYKDVVTRLAQHFQVEVCYSIVNVYRNGGAGIGSHTDSLQNGADITIGASFGDPRELLFEHKHNQQRFEFPQRNGDVFAFTDIANRAFRHSVPKTKDRVAGRLSVIVWARRGVYKPVYLQTLVTPTPHDIENAGGDWNRAQRNAQADAEETSR